MVTQSEKRSTCDWRVAGLNPGLEDQCETISIISALCAVPDFPGKHKTEAPSQSPQWLRLIKLNPLL